MRCRRRYAQGRLDQVSHGWIRYRGIWSRASRPLAAANWRGGGGRRADRSTGDAHACHRRDRRGGRLGVGPASRHCTLRAKAAPPADVVEAIVASQGVWCGMTIPRVYPECRENLVAVVQDGWRNIRRLIDAVRVSPCPPTLESPGRTPPDACSPTVVCLDTGSPAVFDRRHHGGRCRLGSGTARVASRRATTLIAGCCGGVGP